MIKVQNPMTSFLVSRVWLRLIEKKRSSAKKCENQFKELAWLASNWLKEKLCQNAHMSYWSSLDVFSFHPFSVLILNIFYSMSPNSWRADSFNFLCSCFWTGLLWYASSNLMSIALARGLLGPLEILGTSCEISWSISTSASCSVSFFLLWERTETLYED